MTTVEERYGRAIRSSHLEVTTVRAGDIDKLVAAGWLKDGFGTTLYRLRTEYDSVAAEVGRVERVHRQQLADADDEAGSVTVGPTRARAIEEEATREFLAARAFILLRLKTLAAARQQIGSFAMRLANQPRVRCSLDNATVAVIAGRVLDAFLDPLCHHCQGTRFTGEWGAMRTLCRHCRGTGQRRGWIGRTPEEQTFAAALLAELEMQHANVDASMRNYLRER